MTRCLCFVAALFALSLLGAVFLSMQTAGMGADWFVWELTGLYVCVSQYADGWDGRTEAQHGRPGLALRLAPPDGRQGSPRVPRVSQKHQRQQDGPSRPQGHQLLPH